MTSHRLAGNASIKTCGGKWVSQCSVTRVLCWVGAMDRVDRYFQTGVVALFWHISQCIGPI